MTEIQPLPQLQPPGLGQTRVSPFIPADQLPPQRNAPLAPSQELAYREKCIQLKRRLIEIETENDLKRVRIAREKQLHMKMRLNRAILLDKLREVMESRGGPVSKQELVDMLGFEQIEGDEDDQTYEQLQAQSKKRRRIQTRDEEMLDDMSEDTDEDDPEPVERPVRTRRANDSAAPRDVLMGTNSTPATMNQISYPPNGAPMYQSPSTSGLQPLAPAQSAYTSTSKPPMQSLTGAFQVGTTIPVIAQPGQPIRFLDGTPDPRPIPAASFSAPPPPQPVRPAPPYDQFTDHMRPQLLRDNYPRDQMDARIRKEWDELSLENKGLWEARYEDQMREYECGMDEVRKWQRRQQTSGQIIMGVPK